MDNNQRVGDIASGLAGGFGGQNLYQNIQPYVDPALQKIQQLYQMLFGQAQDPNADMMWDPTTGQPKHVSPLRRQMMQRK